MCVGLIVINVFFLLQLTLIQTKYSRLSSVDQACSEWGIWVACMEVEWAVAVTVPVVLIFNLDNLEEKEKTAHLANLYCLVGKSPLSCMCAYYYSIK